MKKLLFLFGLLFLTIVCSSQILFLGNLVDANNKKIKNVTIKLYEENKLISSKNWSNKFKYDLEVEKYYTLKLIKKGFISKKIAISTFEGDKNAEPFRFVMELVKEQDKIEDFDTDFPIALIHYKKDEGTFKFNVQYQQSVKKEKIEALKKNKKEIKTSTKTNSF